jgi:hypothetical protein
VRPELAQRVLESRQEADELEALGAEPGHDERGVDRRRSRQHGHRHAGVKRRSDEPGTRIADAGKSGVADERHPLTGKAR